jgi:type I pantothenate kinase
VSPAQLPQNSDPVLVDLARRLDAEADRRAGRWSGEQDHTVPWRRADAGADALPVIVAVVGSVAVGKSTTAAQLAGSLSATAEVVGTDAFLLSNEQLEPLGGAARKGYPESFDWAALDAFLAGAREGGAPLESPVYSHEVFDVLPGVVRRLEVPEVLVVEGLNLLQRPPGATPPPSQHLDLGIYLEAPEELLEHWFVERFVALTRPDEGEPSEFYLQFAAMGDDDLRRTARWVWREINAPNLHLHVAPSRQRADLVLHKGRDHRIEQVERLR